MPVPLACLRLETLPASGDPVPRTPASGNAVFTSVHAVHGAARLRPFPWPGVRALAIGAATRDALVRAGQRPWAEPVAPYTSEALLAWLVAAQGPPLADGTTIVKGVGGRGVLESGLAEAGAPVATLEVYRRTLPVHDAREVRRALEPVPDILCTTSDEVLDNLLTLAGDRARSLLARPLVVNGERGAAHARSRGFAAEVMVASPPGDAGQLECLARWSRA